MNDTILDAPGESFSVINNKVGGFFTTPAMYIAPLMMLAGVILSKLFGVFGLVFFLGGIPFLFSSSWIAIDPNTKRMREYWQMLGMQFGDWKGLPPVKGVSVVRVRSTKTVASRGSQTTMSDFTYKVRLIAVEGREGWDVISSEKKETAFSKGAQLATLFDVEVADFTEPKASSTRRR
jgi:hypothetical protein